MKRVFKKKGPAYGKLANLYHLEEYLNNDKFKEILSNIHPE